MSRMIIWTLSLLRMPAIRCLVVCALGEVMARVSPMSLLRSEDFPAFGNPATVTIPAFVVDESLVVFIGVGWEMGVGKSTKPPSHWTSSRWRGLQGGAGDGLLSRDLSTGVPSALSGLTTVFGMGTGVALTL